MTNNTISDNNINHKLPSLLKLEQLILSRRILVRDIFVSDIPNYKQQLESQIKNYYSSL